jgi:hypothetical protein
VPAVQLAVPFCVAAPVIATVTMLLSPAALPQVPATDVMDAFVEYGKVRALPLTLVTVTVGAVRSMMIDCAPLEPTLPAVSVCVAVTL